MWCNTPASRANKGLAFSLNSRRHALGTDSSTQLVSLENDAGKRPMWMQKVKREMSGNLHGPTGNWFLAEISQRSVLSILRKRAHFYVTSSSLLAFCWLHLFLREQERRRRKKKTSLKSSRVMWQKDKTYHIRSAVILLQMRGKKMNTPSPDFCMWPSFFRIFCRLNVAHFFVHENSVFLEYYYEIPKMGFSF